MDASLKHDLWLGSLDLANSCAQLERIAAILERHPPLKANARHLRKVGASMFKDRQAIMAEVDPARKSAEDERG